MMSKIVETLMNPVAEKLQFDYRAARVYLFVPFDFDSLNEYFVM